MPFDIAPSAYARVRGRVCAAFVQRRSSKDLDERGKRLRSDIEELYARLQAAIR